MAGWQDPRWILSSCCGSICAGEDVWGGLCLGVAYLYNTGLRLHVCSGLPWLGLAGQQRCKGGMTLTAF